MSATRTITVLGPTGVQGAPVVDRLLAAGHRVRAAARDVARIHQRWGGRVEAVALDLADPDSVAAALEGADGAFLHLPLPASTAQAIANAGGLIGGLARSRLPLAVFTGSGFGIDALPDTAFTAAGRQVVAGLRATGRPLVVLRPTIYLENLRWPQQAARIRSEGIIDYPPLRADRPVSWTDLDDQAALAVAALGRPDLAGTVTDIATPGALTGTELAAAIAAALGRPVRYAPLSPLAFGEHLAAVFANPGLGSAIADLYTAIEATPLEATRIDDDLVAARFGVRLPTLRQRLAAWA